MGSIPGLKKLKEIFNLETDGTIATLLQGKDDTDTKQTVSVDSSGRINLGADIDMGNVHLLDDTDTEINPATEPTLSNIYSEVMKAADQPLDVSATEVDVNINSQTLAQVASLLELDDGGGTYGEIYRRNNAIRQSIENDQVGLLKTGDQPLDVSSAEVDVDLSTNTVGLLESADQPLDVSASELDVDINSQTLAQISALLELDDGGGAYGEIYRRNNALRQSIENDEVGLFKSTDFTETRTIDGDNVGLAKESSLTSEQPRESRDRTFPNLSYGEDTVSTAGTAEALNGGTSLTIPKGAEIVIQALESNSGDVYIGDSGVSSADGFPLSAKDKLTLRVNDVSSVYIDVDNDGEGVRWMVESE